MKRCDKLLSVITLGTLAPVVFFLLFWWGSLPFMKDNKTVLILSVAGLTLGILLDFTVLRRFLLKLFDLSLPVLAAIEIFYSVMVYGFFMGFPVFNSFVGIIGGYIIAKQSMLHHADGDELIKSRNFILRISTGILLILCICTAVLALRESSICSQIKGMLMLPFDVTMGMIWALILTGGTGLLLFQYGISRLVFRKVK